MYINPEISNEEREKGNALFKEQKFAEAITHYTEAIKRNPQDARNFSNRAATYTKLMAFPEALKDCEEALAVDPTFGSFLLSFFSSPIFLFIQQ